MAFSFWLAWNVTTRRAVIGISSPVFGLRPGRCGFSRSWKLPNPDSFTLSPRSSAIRISSKKCSTMSLASRLLRPSCSKRRSANSAFVSVITGILLAERRAETINGDLQQRALDRVDFGVGQSTFSILYKHKNRKAFFAGSDSGPAIDIKEADVVYSCGFHAGQG